MTIRPIAFLDTHALSVLVWRERKLFDQEGPERGRRNTDIWSRLKLKEWKTASSVVGKALNAMAQMDAISGGSGERPGLAGVSIEKLLPHSYVAWDRDVEFADLNLRFHLPILTNPACHVHSGIASAHLPVGQLTFVGSDVLHSAVNHGDTPRYHLIVDVKKPIPEIEEPVGGKD